VRIIDGQFFYSFQNIPQDEGDQEFSFIPSDNGTSNSKNKSKTDKVVLTAAELIAKKRAEKALAAQLASETPFETYQRKAKEKKSAKRAATAAKAKVIVLYIHTHRFTAFYTLCLSSMYRSGTTHSFDLCVVYVRRILLIT
jgi:hypothetical protein